MGSGGGGGGGGSYIFRDLGEGSFIPMDLGGKQKMRF